MSFPIGNHKIYYTNIKCLTTAAEIGVPNNKCPFTLTRADNENMPYMFSNHELS